MRAFLICAAEFLRTITLTIAFIQINLKGDEKMAEFSGVGIFLIIALFFPLMALVPSWLVQPRQPTEEKQKPYECGVDTIGKSWVQYRVSYFLYALVFVVFDIETVFLYPWAVKFGELGLFALIEMFIFVGILTMGLWYAWKKGALTWK